MTQLHEQRSNQPKPKDIGNLQPEQCGTYYKVPGWRVWERTIFDSPKYIQAEEEAGRKPMALRVTVDGKGYQAVWDKHMEATGHRIPGLFRTGTLDRPSFLLEPLGDEEVRRIDEQGEAPGPLGSIDKPHELLRPTDLIAILEPETRRQKK